MSNRCDHIGPEMTVLDVVGKRTDMGVVSCILNAFNIQDTSPLLFLARGTRRNKVLDKVSTAILGDA